MYCIEPNKKAAMVTHGSFFIHFNRNQAFSRASVLVVRSQTSLGP